MADVKNPMSRHLRSARQWLTKAEESFDNDRQVSGELNLLLAQAELEHAKEANRGQRTKKYPFLLHGLALTVAICFAVAGFRAYSLLDERRQSTPIPAGETRTESAVQADPAPKVVELQKSTESTRQTPTPAIVSTAAGVVLKPPPDTGRRLTTESDTSGTTVQTEPSEKQPEPVKSLAPEKTPVISREEMRQIIQAAGKSLRGE